ncbi:ABC transporter ATP-binding protein [Desulfosporosinus fructosivorans]|uniref:ABC transporter ATP-binding protein n=1 Tax=Desulfosporosinus fructosivorans TaxID=2018669 RepID=A0A4Z0QVF2_9FIRM|nr:ABC transporter ATP-binding protein [Desulfosporosinus fructosivorans]TGE34772.1 ABC transporter ATP-binding protein [Desulfosporosinus fructosivorans]
MNESIIDVRNVEKKFYIGTPNELQILKNVSLSVKKGEFISIVGASGSGKSTLMNIIGALDRPTLGEYVLDGNPIQDMTDNDLSDTRNTMIGFVFQTFNLIARNSALKNVELPMLYAGVGRKARREKAEQLLELVGMEDRIHHLPNELSGGQKQRVAIARALSNDPAIVLLDEPTGSLDSETGEMVMNIFHKIHKTKGTTIILITHNNELAEQTQRIVTIKDGYILNEKINANL